MPRELHTWGDEFSAHVQRRWWVALIVFFFFSWLPPVPPVQVASAIGILALAAIVVIWFAATVGWMPRTTGDKWKRQTVRSILTSWGTVAARLGLSVQDYVTRAAIGPSISVPAWDRWTCVIRLVLPQGLGRQQLQAQADMLAQAFGARGATVEGDHIGSLVLRLEFVDALEQPFYREIPMPWDGRTVTMGMTASGASWALRLGPHTLVAGSSGSGKASLVWGLLLGLAEPIHSGLVEVWGVDRKGGMELALGRALLTRFAADAEPGMPVGNEADVGSVEHPTCGRFLAHRLDAHPDAEIDAM